MFDEEKSICMAEIIGLLDQNIPRTQAIMMKMYMQRLCGGGG